MKYLSPFRRIFALALALVLWITALPALAESYPFVGFTTASLRLRQRPSDTSDVLITIPSGDAVIITGESGNYYIALYEGKQGYAMKSYITTGQGAAQQPAAPSAPVAPQSTQAPATPYTLLYAGNQGAAVRALQEALEELGFYSGKIDGDFGSGTKNAVISFQRQNGLTQTGTADGALQQLLFEGKPKNAKGKAVSVKTVSYLEGALIQSGSTGEAVEKLQTRLKELGYYTATVDGDCGSGTVNAIKKFQKKAGLSQTGKADATTQALLYSLSAPHANATATPKPTATPTPIPTNKPTPIPEATYPFTTYTLTSVNMRKGPSTDTARLATLSAGVEIVVLSMDGDFLHINYQNKTGYVMSQYVKVPTQYLPGKDLAGDNEAWQHYPYLQLGSKGRHVALLKEALNELGFYSGAFDEEFDSRLVTALKNFQKQNGIRQDGVATPEVQQLIFEGKPKNNKGKATNIKLLPPIEGYEMKLNDKGEAVMELQQMLRQLGHYDGAYSMTFDTATQKAVKAFQKAHTLTVDGVVGKKTWTLLTALAAVPTPAPNNGNQPLIQPANTPLTEQNVIVMQNGTRGMAVTRLQQRLVELGYYTCTPDGIYNSDDIAAVKAFQRKNGLKIDGIAGLDTQLALYADTALPATSAAMPAATPAPTPVPTPVPSYETLRIGSKGTAVAAMQQKLKELGYYTGQLDGLFGTGTARSVTLFQRANNLDADGVAGEKTLKKLYSGQVLSVATPAPTKKPAGSTNTGSSNPLSSSVTLLQSGDKGENVRAMQQRLVDLGYLATADGVFGVRTYNAVVAFQRRNGLTADGLAGKMTLNRLFSSAATAAQDSLIPSLPNQGVLPEPEEITFKAPDPAEVRYANWFTEIRARARLMPDVVIYDPDSGLHFNLHMFSFGKHADSEPPTAADTEILYQINGKDNWDPKYVWVIFSDGRVYIASIHSNGHTVDHTSDNNMVGHICLHFPRIMSEAEATGPYAVRHQKEILYGWELTQAKIR